MLKQEVTLAELAKHSTKTDLWVCIHGKVYDLSHYREDHPGGVDSLLEVAGQDATDAFEDLGHTQDARETMARFEIGTLEGYEETQQERQEIQRRLAPVPDALSPKTHHLSPAFITILSATTLGSYVLLKAHDHSTQSGVSVFTELTRRLPSFLPLVPVAVISSVIAAAIMHSYSTMIHNGAPNPRSFPSHKPATAPALSSVASHAVLQPRQFIRLPITSVQQVSPNTKLIELDLPHRKDVLGLPIGQHIAIQSPKHVTRSYTPISSNRDRGVLRLLIKMYKDGQLTGGYLDDLKAGDELSVSGPRGQMRYRKGLASHIGMVAGGSGITPMYQILRAIREDPTDDTLVDLVYANNNLEDILLKRELDEFVQAKPGQLNVHYVLSNPPAGWTGYAGRITEAMCREKFGLAAQDKKVFMCGPPPMLEAAKGWLLGMGYAKPRAVSKFDDQVFLF